MNSIHVLALMSFALLAGAAANESVNKGTLEELCRLEKKGPEVTRQSDVRSLIELLKNDQSVKCPAEVKAAILDLEPVIELTDVCSEGAIDVIVDFWAKHVQKSSRKSKHLPKPLKNFFVSYGLQVSKVCKRTMIEQLKQATDAQGISQKDIDIVTKPIKDNDKMTDLFGEQPKLEGLLMVTRVDSAKTNAAKITEEGRGKINMPPKEKKYFELMQERCLNKFKPVYDSLVLPAVRLASIGMNYKGESLEAELAAFRQQPVYLDWFAAVVACEPMLKYDAVLIPAQKVTEDGNTATITVLDDEDIAELKAKTGLTLEEPALVEPIDYKVEARVDDLVLDTTDSHLSNSLTWYGKGLKEVTKYRLSMAKRLPKLAKAALKDNRARFGLKPTATSTKDLENFGISRKSTLRILILSVGFALLGGISAAMAILVGVSWPLAPLWVIGGSVLLMLTLVFMLFGYMISGYY